MTREGKSLPPCQIFIDKEGYWYHKAAKMIHREIISLFYQNMTRLSDGTYLIEWSGQRCFVEVEDTAFVVWSLTFKEKSASEGPRFVLGLSDGTSEYLDPETLYIGENNVLYCRVKGSGREFPARFNRASYYQLAEYIEEESGEFFITVDGARYFIKARQGTPL
ncbi:hypothetical protein ACFL2O_06250 [Thermodesulfobacteriota bacterium]